MTAEALGGGKRPGKTDFAVPRRAMTRKSGFKVHADTTGGEFKRHSAPVISLAAHKAVAVTFDIRGHKKGDWIGYGAWFWRTPSVACSVEGGPPRKKVLKDYFEHDAWSKAGSMWQAEDGSPVKVTLTFISSKGGGELALYAPLCGRIRNEHLTDAPTNLTGNMYQFAPEALFISEEDAGQVTVNGEKHIQNAGKELVLKSCNRCARYLPVNVPTERNQLSFNNHCVAYHLRPCKHGTFGRLKNETDKLDVIALEYGFQLECRFCKKFVVNAAHNPRRSAAQTKEDGARRRAVQSLLDELYGGGDYLRYRIKHRSELPDDVWMRFDKKCFQCGEEIPTPKAMNLDHTRPLAYLWPLDGTATCLCKNCNSEKSDRMPFEFYTKPQLARLARITGLPLKALTSVQPNDEAIALLIEKIEWFFDVFLVRDQMVEVRDGKRAGDLLLKALQRALSASEVYQFTDLRVEYELGKQQSAKQL